MTAEKIKMTVRLLPVLNNRLNDYAKQKDMTKNGVIKLALNKLLGTEKVCTKLKQRREAAGLTIEDMMAILGMTKTEYEALENGTVLLTPELEEIVDATI